VAGAVSGFFVASQIATRDRTVVRTIRAPDNSSCNRSSTVRTCLRVRLEREAFSYSSAIRCALFLFVSLVLARR
jgi:hypothetical protein